MNDPPGGIGGMFTCGTPSIAFGTSSPCQWMLVSSRIVLRTTMRAVSPSVKRSVGAGMLPFTAIASASRPEKLTRV